MAIPSSRRGQSASPPRPPAVEDRIILSDDQDLLACDRLLHEVEINTHFLPQAEVDFPFGIALISE